jgi:hypothetical protein
MDLKLALSMRVEHKAEGVEEQGADEDIWT